MPTAEFPVGAQTRDIFRTIDGVNLNIGPNDRLRAGAVGDFSNQAPLISVTPAAYPRIVLRDSLGYELDTYTTLQEAIYRAKWNVRTTGQSKTPLEWRLPKAPPPARPDLTRTFPPVKHPQLAGGYGKTTGITGNILEIDVDDVSFVKESLDRLPYVPSLSFLRQEILVGPKTYFQIVGTMLLHKRLLSETEKRHAIYNFPGFCSGCIRMGLCYGCERSTEPHYHEDKLVKTGGGFTYYKKDRPEREMKHKNPINWKINHPDQVLKRLMEDYAGVHLDGDVSTKVNEHLDTHTDRRTRHVSEDRDAMDVEYLNRDRSRGDDGRFLPNIDPRYITEQQRDSSLLGYATPGQGQGQGRDQSVDPCMYPSDVDIDMFEQEQGQRKVLSKRSTKTDLNDDSKYGEDEQHSGEINGYAQSGTRSKGDKSNGGVSDTRYNDYERYEHRLPKYRKTESEDDTDSEGKRDYEGDDESRGRKRDRLYKPPPPFKVKRSPKRRIEAKSPFSTDRSYDIPKGQDFVPRKSNKKPTEFVDFRDVDVSWKAPKKFELKKPNHKPTKFWSGARTKKKEKSRSRSPKARRQPSPRSPSPDSGLDTGFMTESDVEVATNRQHSELVSDDVQPCSKKRPTENLEYSGTSDGVSTERNNSKREPSKPAISVPKTISKTVHLIDGMITSPASVSSAGTLSKRYTRQNSSPSLEETEYRTGNKREHSLLFREINSEDMRRNSAYPQAEENALHGLTPSSIEMSKTKSRERFTKFKKEIKYIDSLPRGKNSNFDQTREVSTLKPRSDVKGILDKENGFRNHKAIKNEDDTNTSNSMHNVSKGTENYNNKLSPYEKIKLPKVKVPSNMPNVGGRRETQHISLPKLQQKSQQSYVQGSRGTGNYREIVNFPLIAPRQGYISAAVESESDDSVFVNQNTNPEVVESFQRKQSHKQRDFEEQTLSKKEEQEKIREYRDDCYEILLNSTEEFDDLKGEISTEKVKNSEAYTVRKMKRISDFETIRNQKQLKLQDDFKSKDKLTPFKNDWNSTSTPDTRLSDVNGSSREQSTSTKYNIKSCGGSESGEGGRIDLKGTRPPTENKNKSTKKRTTHYNEFTSDSDIGDTFTDNNANFKKESRIPKQRQLDRRDLYEDKKDLMQLNDHFAERINKEDINESEFPVKNIENRKRTKTKRLKPNFKRVEKHNKSLTQRSSSNNSLKKEKPDLHQRGDDKKKDIERCFIKGLYTESFEDTYTNRSQDVNSNKEKSKDTTIDKDLKNNEFRNFDPKQMQPVTRRIPERVFPKNKQTDSGIFNSDEKNNQIDESEHDMTGRNYNTILDNSMKAKNDDGPVYLTNHCYEEIVLDNYKGGCTYDLELMNHSANLMCVKDNQSNVNVLNKRTISHDPDDGNIGDDEYDDQSDTDCLNWDNRAKSGNSNSYNPVSDGIGVNRTYDTKKELNQIQIYHGGFSSSDIHLSTTDFEEESTDTEPKSNNSNKGKTIEKRYQSIVKVSQNRHENMSIRYEKEKDGLNFSDSSVSESDDGYSITKYKPDLDENEVAKVEDKTQNKKQHGGKKYTKPRKLKDTLTNEKTIVALQHNVEISFSEQDTDKSSSEQAAEDRLMNFQITGPFGNEQMLSNDKKPLILREIDTDQFDSFDHNNERLDQNISKSGHKTSDKLNNYSTLPKTSDKEHIFHSTYTYSDVTISDTDEKDSNLRENSDKEDERVGEKKYGKHTRCDNKSIFKGGNGEKRMERKHRFQRNIEGDNKGNESNPGRTHPNDSSSKLEHGWNASMDKTVNSVFESTKYDKYLQREYNVVNVEQIEGILDSRKENKLEKSGETTQKRPAFDKRSFRSYDRAPETPETLIYRDQSSSVDDTVKDSETKCLTSYRDQNNQDGIKIVARRGRYTYRKHDAQNKDSPLTPTQDSLHHRTEVDEHYKLHKLGVEQGDMWNKDVKEYFANGLKPAAQQHYRQSSRVHYLRRAYSNSDVPAENELRKRTLQNQYIRAGRTQSEDILEDYRKRSNSDDVNLQTSGMTKRFASDSKFKGFNERMCYSKRTRRTLSSSDTPSQKEYETASLNMEDGITLKIKDLEDEAKEKRLSTTSIRTISIDMTSLSPHLHMVEPDSSSLSGESVSPPLIPNNVAFDVNSVTSEEPELDLEFNDVIDVENMEEDETAFGNETSQLIDEKRRKRHRHKKRRRKPDRISKETNSNIEKEQAILLPSEEKETENTGIDDTQQERVYGGVDDKVFFEAVKMINDETRQFNTPTLHSEKESASCENEVFTEEKDVFNIDDSDGNIDPEMSERHDIGYTIIHDQNLLNDHREKKIFSDTDLSEKANNGNWVNTKILGDVEASTDKDYHIVDSQKKDEQKKPRHDKKKIKTRRKNNEDYEIDFAALPSIETQVAKIMYNYNYDDQANTTLSSRSSCRSSRRHSIATPSIARQRLYRSRSVSKGSRSRRSSIKRILKKKRSKSLPNTNELIAMKDQIDTNSNGPIPVPVYLGSFPSQIAKKQFKTILDRKRVQGRGRSMSLFITDEDGTNKSELEPLREESQVIDTAEMDRVLTPSTTRIPTPASTNSLLSNGSLSNTNNSFNTSVTKPPSTLGEGHKQSLVVGDDSCTKLGKEPPKSPVKREIIKKERRAKTPVPAPVRSPSPVEEPPHVSPTPEPVEDDEPVSREISFEFIREPPELPPIEVPELPHIPESQPTEYKGIKREKKLIEVSPELPAQKKKFPPPPKPRPQIRSRAPSRKTKVAEAPVTTQELQQMIDPLDFLAKYCIINPDRLPFYERVFNGALSVQTPRYNRGTEAPKGAIVHLPPAQLSDHELNMLKDITVLNQGHCPRNDGISAPEQYLEKLNYSIGFIKSKQDVIQSHMEKVQAEKMQFMAGMAKKWDRDIVRLDYKTKIKKKKKKKKKKKGEEPDYDQMGALSDKTNFQPMKMSDITDEVIVSRMDDKMMKKIKKDPVYLKYKMELGRDIEKLKHYDERVAQIEDEKDLVGLYCMDYYFSEQGALNRPQEFRRQQSRLYQKLHPDPDIEMNIEEVEPALQQINNKLLTQREFQYIYFILDLPKREKINFRLFSIVAALSEKVTQMDPVIRKLINKVDYNALDVKLEKSKELFQLLQDERVLPQGNAPSDNLAVELTAGGLTPEHTTYVMNKFDREGRGFIDFMDFVTYVPLFIEIHSRIIDDPFNDTLCV